MPATAAPPTSPPRTAQPRRSRPALAAALVVVLASLCVPTQDALGQAGSLAKFEPAHGCYLGAYIDFDSGLGRPPYRDQNQTEHHMPEAFEGRVGKQHAMYFFYMGYGRPLPMDWVRALAQRGKFVHIALEPNDGLPKVVDNAYLRRLADDMRASGARIFLRFASEMNGPWTHYSRRPALYRRKFRLVYQVMRKRAPNVAMVWCPFVEPSRTIPDYYPGDDATDWVGINFYSVTYHDNDPRQRAEYERPVDLLGPIYRRYASRKPIMICEFAATHRSVVDHADRSDFAIGKIRELYRALPQRFPRVKCINYFDGNNLSYVPDRTLNDYSVTNHPAVLAAYREAVSQPHFLSGIEAGAPPIARATPAPPIRLASVARTIATPIARPAATPARPAAAPRPSTRRPPRRHRAAPPKPPVPSASPRMASVAMADSGRTQPAPAIASPLAKLPPALQWIGAGMLLLAVVAVWQIVALIRLRSETGDRSRAVVFRAIK